MEKELPKLDLKDKKILSLLEKDARMSASEIAKKVGLSKPSVAKRIDSLVQSGIIDKFILHVNFRALNVVNYRLYAKFEKIPENFEQALSEYLLSDGRVRWFSLCQGEWDVIIRTMVKDIYEFRAFEQDFFVKFGKHIKVRTFSIIINDAYHNCTYLTGNEGNNSNPTKDYSGVPVQLSETDARLLFWLAENSRMPYRELAEKAGISPEAASYHLKKLEKEGVITGCMAKISREKIGYNEAKVLLWFQYATPHDLAKFRKYCEAHPQVSFFGEIIGPWDMEVDFDVKNTGHLYSILREMRSKFPDIIRDFKVMEKIREVEVNFMARKAGIRVPKPR